MEILIEKGTSRGDCVGKITERYGPWFHILTERKIRIGGFCGIGTREGVELEFYIPPHPNRNSPWQNAPIPFPPSAVQVSSPVSAESAVPAMAGSSPRQGGTAGWTGSGNAALDFQEAKKRVLEAAGKNPEAAEAWAASQAETVKESSQRQILEELREIKEKIDSGTVRTDEHPSLIRIADMLALNDFSRQYINDMLDRARKELPLEVLNDFGETQDRLLEWIGETIGIYKESAVPSGGRILVLVGPTGVGKTTTIAKLAAIYGLGSPGKPPRKVRMITIDAFRIGARAQIEAYGDIMELPVSYVDNRRDLRREIALYQDETDIILIDTIGKSPKDSAKLGEMKGVLDACGSRAEIHLVLSASTKTSDLEQILRQFEPFDYRSVVLTKLDETSHVGNVISALFSRNKPVSYITDGQNVPKDITKACVIRFLINLEEFKVNREKIEKRFPVDEAEQFEWS
ncbi:MAG: flagellar biosynthesis protein FlhF [Treponema sp.]|jgi:flagellar biosynthesis protein FlhF|nr:flagellar biosynthesis protein FlhF [Treponema sp.]